MMNVANMSSNAPIHHCPGSTILDCEDYYWILGIHPTYEWLKIKPVIPSAWSGFDAVRIYRGVRYTIHVERLGPGNQIGMEINGKPVKGDIIPIPPVEIKEMHVVLRLR
jgi:cellobiose phosphorylase